MTRRTERFELRLTPEEKSRLRRKAKRHGMSVADYLRTMALNFENGVIVTIDVSSLESVAHELLKQGTNLNQLMYFLNSYGIEDYNAKEVRPGARLEGDSLSASVRCHPIVAGGSTEASCPCLQR